MTNKQMEKYTTIEKSIPLTREEYIRLMRAQNLAGSIKESILDMLIKAHTKIEDRQQAVWNELAQRFGFEDLLDAHAKGKTIEISWATQQLNLRSEGDKPVSSP